MATVKFFKVSALPVEPLEDAFYFVQNGDYAESWLTDGDGVPHHIGNSEMIDELIAESMAEFNRVEIVADIAARDALSTNDFNFLVLVIDATADETVDAGAAVYAFRNSDNTWFKVSEYESLDLVINWTDIVGRPASTPSAIDEAVTNSHTHANKALLDNISEVDGRLAYDGNPIPQWDETAW